MAVEEVRGVEREERCHPDDDGPQYPIADIKVVVGKAARLVRQNAMVPILSGILRKELMSPARHAGLALYEPQPAEDVIVLQNHNNKVRFRNIRVRRLGAYDEPERPRR